MLWIPSSVCDALKRSLGSFRKQLGTTGADYLLAKLMHRGGGLKWVQNGYCDKTAGPLRLLLVWSEA